MLHVSGNVQIDGTLMADAFEADAINKGHILDEAGIAADETMVDYYLGSDWTGFHSADIDIPAPGCVLAIASVSVHLDHGISGSTSADIIITHNGERLAYTGHTVPYQADAALYQPEIVCIGYTTVSSAGTATFNVEGRTLHSNPARVGYSELFLIYLPTDYSPVAKSRNVQDKIDAVLQARSSGPERSLSSEDPGKQPALSVSELSAQVEALTNRIEELEAKIADR
jgi:hypothetical protein